MAAEYGVLSHHVLWSQILPSVPAEEIEANQTAVLEHFNTSISEADMFL